MDPGTWWQSVPFATKMLILISLGLWLLNLLISGVFYQGMKLKPQQIIYLQFWRLFTCALIQDNNIGSLIQMLFNFICIFDMMKIEKRIGTILFLIEFFIKNAIAQLINIALSLFISLFYQNILKQETFGFWNIVIYFAAQRTLIYPNDDQQFLFLPFVLKAKYNLIIILILLTILQFFRLDIFCFTLLAVIEVKILKKNLFRLSKQKIEFIERSALFSKYQSRQDFIIIDHADDLVFSGTQPIQFNVENFNEKQAESKKNQEEQIKLDQLPEIQAIQESTQKEKIDGQESQGDQESQEKVQQEQQFNNPPIEPIQKPKKYEHLSDDNV